MSDKMLAIAASVCAFGVTGLGIGAFAQQTQAPSMPPDLANMAQSARAHGGSGAVARKCKSNSTCRITTTA